jgi:hypothetical protein
MFGHRDGERSRDARFALEQGVIEGNGARSAWHATASLLDDVRDLVPENAPSLARERVILAWREAGSHAPRCDLGRVHWGQVE